MEKEFQTEMKLKMDLDANMINIIASYLKVNFWMVKEMGKEKNMINMEI